MSPKYMNVDVLAAMRSATAHANDSASLLALAQWIGRNYPDDPAATQLLANIATKREQLRAPGGMQARTPGTLTDTPHEGGTSDLPRA